MIASRKETTGGDGTRGAAAGAADDAVSRETDDDTLEELTPLVKRAAAFADEWDAAYRGFVFEAALRRLLTAHGSAAALTGAPSGSTSDTEDSATAAPFYGKLARVLGTEPGGLSRVVELGADGKPQILARFDGRTKRELQTKYSLVYLFVAEVGLGARSVDVEDLRRVVVDHGCYDQGNFTGNFRKDANDGLIREILEKGGRTRRYLATKRGLDEAATMLRTAVES